jgi:MYXO-CTERM domain-containing protein
VARCLPLAASFTFGVLAALLAPRDASAFCGTYVGGPDAALFNRASKIIVTRQEDSTTLTLANDLVGDVTDFALVVPVPEVLSAEDVRVVAPELFTRLDAYSSPRLVSYTCDDFAGGESDTAATDQDSGGGSGGEAEGVTVEASFSEGEYDIVILSATESSALLTWLDTNGYAVSETAGELLQEYIDAGAYFFAAKVSLAALPEEATYLSPLQLRYSDPVFSLPVRLGTANAEDEQDLLLFVMGDEGQTHISNYPQAQVEDECLFDEAAFESFSAFYDERFVKALDDVGRDRASWVLEYAWDPGSCDPCSGEPLDTEVIEELGWVGDWGSATFTRLHLRYGPGAVDQDLVLYGSNIRDQEQVRYVLYDEALEDRFPRCIDGWADDPGSCGGETDDDDDGPDDESGDPAEVDRGAEPKLSCGISSAPARGVLGLAALVSLVARRRRRDAR